MCVHLPPCGVCYCSASCARCEKSRRRPLSCNCPYERGAQKAENFLMESAASARNGYLDFISSQTSWSVLLALVFWDLLGISSSPRGVTRSRYTVGTPRSSHGTSMVTASAWYCERVPLLLFLLLPLAWGGAHRGRPKRKVLTAIIVKKYDDESSPRRSAASCPFCPRSWHALARTRGGEHGDRVAPHDSAIDGSE